MRSRGFTLVELIIVIAIVGILGALLTAVINPAKQLQKSRDAGRKAALKTLQTAIEQYYTDNGSYPTISCNSGLTAVSTGCWSLGNGATNLLGARASSYIKAMPADPKQNGTTCTSTANYGYQYVGVAGGATYTLVTHLENSNDPQIQAGTVAGCTWGNSYSLVNQQ